MEPIRNGGTYDRNIQGFISSGETKYYSLIFKRSDGIQVKLSFADDYLTPARLGENVDVSWEYRLIDLKTGKVLWKNWIEYDEGTSEEKIIGMKEDILKFIVKIDHTPIRFVEKSVFKIFGRTLFKFKEIEFQTSDGWTRELF